MGNKSFSYQAAIWSSTLSIIHLLTVAMLACLLVLGQAEAKQTDKATQATVQTTITIGGEQIKLTTIDLDRIQRKLVERIKTSGEPYADALARRTQSNPSFVTADGNAHIGGLWRMQSGENNLDYAVLKLSGTLPSSGVALIPWARLTRSEGKWRVGKIEDQHVFIGSPD